MADKEEELVRAHWVEESWILGIKGAWENEWEYKEGLLFFSSSLH